MRHKNRLRPTHMTHDNTQITFGGDAQREKGAAREEGLGRAAERRKTLDKNHRKGAERETPISRSATDVQQWTDTSACLICRRAPRMSTAGGSEATKWRNFKELQTDSQRRGGGRGSLIVSDSVWPSKTSCTIRTVVSCDLWFGTDTAISCTTRTMVRVGGKAHSNESVSKTKASDCSAMSVSDCGFIATATGRCYC